MWEDHDIHCINREGHGTQTIKEAVQNSCNVALMQIGALIGKDNLSKYQHVFGFGELTGIDLPGDASTEVCCIRRKIWMMPAWQPTHLDRTLQ